MATTIMFALLGYTILMLWICKKAFLFTIFLIIKVYLWNETNLVTRNNLHSFCYWVHNRVLHNGIHDLDSLNLQEKLFFPPFSIQLMLIHEMGQTLILATTTIFSAIGIAIMFSSLENTILTLWICKKSFSFHHFPYN